MKSVLISIRPKWCELIASGKKTIEVRKTRPKIETPFKCYIYCTKPSKKHQTIVGCMVLNDDELFKLPNGKIKYGDSVEMMLYDDYTADNFLNGKIIGEFVCDGVYQNMSYDCEQSCVSASELREYANGKPLYGWHISDLKIYDKPRELSEFGRGCDAEHINEIHCRDCKKLVSFDDCCEVMCKPLNRPPQSWCYVEQE